MSKPLQAFFLLLFIALTVFAFSFSLIQRHHGGFKSDEASYFAIIQSIAFDLDIVYERKDLERIFERFWIGPTGLFLKKTPSGTLVYAKSFIYPLFAAPFFRIFDVQGIIFFNCLLLFFILLMGFYLLKDYIPEKKALFFSLLFTCGSVLCCYVWWMTADLFNCAAVFAALFFFFKKFSKPFWFYLSPLFAALAILSKPSNLVIFALLYLILLLKKEFRKTLITAMIMLAILWLFILFNEQQSGDWNFMAGERRSFYGYYPYEKPENSFNQAIKMSADDYWQRYFITPQIVALNIFYFFFGRFTGIFFYFFPAIFFLLLFFFFARETEDYFLLAAILASILTFITLAPLDYFGGAGSLGNRYFLNIYPLFFFLGYKNRQLRLKYLPLLMAAVFVFPIAADSMEYSGYPAGPAKNFPYKLLPPEKTLYKSLPTNTNPRAFNRLLKTGSTECRLFFLNDNFYDLEENEFWTFADRSCELLLIAPFQPEGIVFTITNHPANNQVELELDNLKNVLRLKPAQKVSFPFKKVNGLRIDRGYIFHLKIKSREKYFPFARDSGSEDRRVLGVRVKLELLNKNESGNL